MRIKFNKFTIFETGFILLLWLISILVSSPVFNRPLGTHHEWLSAHTLVSMRAFEEWGFWKLLGASVLTPKSYEFLNIDITTLTKDDGIYLSYPSFWLILPYAVFKLLNLLGLNINLSVQYIQTYNLVVNRLLLGFIIYYLCLEIINILTSARLTKFQKSLVAGLFLIGWMFTAPIMYWTQNVYFSDQAVLLPIYTIFLISLKYKFNLNSLSHLNQFFLFILSFLACSIDWYGWVSVAVICLIVLIDQLISVDQFNFSFLLFLKKYLDSIKFMCLGVLLAGLTFLAQILYYEDGVEQLVEIFIRRTSGMVNDYDEPINILTMIQQIMGYWLFYFPKDLEIILRKFIYTDFISQQIDFQYLIAAFITFLFITLWITLLSYTYQKSNNRKLTAYTYILVYLIPLIQIALLKQHSFMHDFSAFKMGLPIIFSVWLLPAVALLRVLDNQLNNQKINSRQSYIYISYFALVLGLFIIFGNSSEFLEFAGESNLTYQEMGSLVSRNTKPDQLLFADSIPDNLVELDEPYEELIFGASPPEPVWYANRFIHSSEEFKDFKGIKPVFFAYKNLLSKSSVKSICEGQWQDAGNIKEHEVVICKAEELRKLLN